MGLFCGLREQMTQRQHVRKVHVAKVRPYKSVTRSHFCISHSFALAAPFVG